MIKINPLDVHDRLNHFYNQSMSSDISECCLDLVKKEPFGQRPFYIFSHCRTLDMDERIALLQDDIQQSLNNSMYIRNQNTRDQPKDGVNSPWDFRCPQYDQRSSNFINAGTHYGVGHRQPVGHMGNPKQFAPTLPGHRINTLQDDDLG